MTRPYFEFADGQFRWYVTSAGGEQVPFDCPDCGLYAQEFSYDPREGLRTVSSRTCGHEWIVGIGDLG